LTRRAGKPSRAASRARIATGLALLALAACSSTPEVDPRYRPAENLLEVIAVLRRHVPDDTYRFAPARDFTDRNVYRSSLLRLESLERVHAEALRAGHMDGVIAFSKGRALERLRSFDLAAEAYRVAAESNQALKVEALRSADLCDSLHRAAGLGPGLDDPAEADADLREPDPEAVMAEFEERVALLEDARAAAEETHYVAVVREEIERADLARAHYFVGLRKLLGEGDVRAVAELQRVVLRHSDSKTLRGARGGVRRRVPTGEPALRHFQVSGAEPGRVAALRDGGQPGRDAREVGGLAPPGGLPGLFVEGRS
jgi:tetratricopeptide (TPR) repeat protein